MSSKIPVVRQIAWMALVPQLIFMGLLILGFYLLRSSTPFIYGTITYLAISNGLRTFIPRHHLQGMKLVKAQKFAAAIPFFEKSYAFFSRNVWVDQYRFLTMLSASGMSYREMALCNIGFCYSQIGEGKKAIDYYTRTLEVFPENGLAQAALRMLGAAEQIQK